MVDFWQKFDHKFKVLSRKSAPGFNQNLLHLRETLAYIRRNYLNETVIKQAGRAEELFYAHDAKDTYSGCRTLAGITGDWRPIDQLARECLEWFKFINPDGLRREGLKVGLKPKF